MSDPGTRRGQVLMAALAGGKGDSRKGEERFERRGLTGKNWAQSTLKQIGGWSRVKGPKSEKGDRQRVKGGGLRLGDGDS